MDRCEPARNHVCPAELGRPGDAPKEKSRGAVIPEMLVADLERARIMFESIDLDGTWPFRLIGIFSSDRTVYEWRWDGERRSELSHEYSARHWFSSGASDEKAEQIRSAACARSWRDKDAGTREWVHRLHATHEPEQGLFSICAHRDLGGTLSYTEIELTRETIALSCSPFSPCNGVHFSDAALIPRLMPSVTFA